MTATTTARRPPSTVAVGPRAIVLNESPSVTPSGSYSAANSNGVTVNIIGIGVGFVGGALLLITLTLLTRLHLARRRAASQGLPRPQLWDVVFDSTRSGGALAIGRSLGGYNYDWDYRGGGGGDIWGARGLGLGGIWGFGLGGASTEKDGEGVGRRPEMREVVLGVVGGKSGGQGQGHEGVRGFGFGGWKPTSLFLHEPSTDNSPPPTTNTVTNTAATTSRPSAPAPASAPAPSNPSPSNPSPSNPNPSNPSPSSPSSNPQGLEIKADSRISTTVLILLPSPKYPYPYTYTDHSARSALTPEMKTDGHGQLRGERDEKKVYEVRHVEDVDVHVADVSDIKDAGDAWGRVMSWGEGDEGRGVDGIPGSGLAGTLSSSATGPRDEQEVRNGEREVREKTVAQGEDGREKPPVQASALSSSLSPQPENPAKTRPQRPTGPGEVHDREEEEDDLPDFVLGVLELEVVADTPQSEVSNAYSGDQVEEGGVVYPPKAALGQPVSGVSPRSDTGESPEATTSTAATRNVNGNGTARERTMPSDGLMRSFWRR